METFSSLFEKSRCGTSWSLRKLQNELAEAHGIKVSYSFLGAIEKGRRAPSYELACALATVLGIDVKQALKAAHNSRMENDKRRESKYIEKTIKKCGLSDISADEITGRK
jgi:transcriptional regulator with XRE-family HTH domain